MGSLFSKAKEVRVLILGLDGAGKSTMVAQLKTGSFQKTNPTVGFNVETYKYKKIKFNLWDVGGQDSIRPLWKHYYTGAQGLIFVIDSTDGERFQLAKDELQGVLSDSEMKDVSVLILANKQDLENAKKPDEITDIINLKSITTHQWTVMPIVASSGEGVEDALGWLSSKISSKK